MWLSYRATGEGWSGGFGGQCQRRWVGTAEVHHVNHAFPISVAAKARKRCVRFGEESSGLEHAGKRTAAQVDTCESKIKMSLLKQPAESLGPSVTVLLTVYAFFLKASFLTAPSLLISSLHTTCIMYPWDMTKAWYKFRQRSNPHLVSG